MKIFYLLYQKEKEFKKPPFFKDKIVILYSFPYKKLAEQLEKWFKERKSQVKIYPFLGCQ